jgi:hypothetical protein
MLRQRRLLALNVARAWSYAPPSAGLMLEGNSGAAPPFPSVEGLNLFTGRISVISSVDQEGRRQIDAFTGRVKAALHLTHKPGEPPTDARPQSTFDRRDWNLLWIDCFGRTGCAVVACFRRLVPSPLGHNLLFAPGACRNHAPSIDHVMRPAGQVPVAY